MTTMGSRPRRVSGGTYKMLTCDGNTNLVGDFNCETFACTGRVYGEKTVTAKVLIATGTVQIRRIRCYSAAFHGFSVVRTRLEASSAFQSRGNITFRGTIIATTVNIEDTIRMEGTLTASWLQARGSIHLDQVDAENITITFKNISTADRINGRNISIERAPFSFLDRALNGRELERNNFMIVKQGITGDYISLENVTVPVVRGVDVNIGPGCKVTNVYYRDHLYIDERAWVGHYEPYDDPVPPAEDDPDEPAGPNAPAGPHAPGMQGAPTVPDMPVTPVGPDTRTPVSNVPMNSALKDHPPFGSDGFCDG